jgi:hypothetical protein
MRPTKADEAALAEVRPRLMRRGHTPIQSSLVEDGDQTADQNLDQGKAVLAGVDPSPKRRRHAFPSTFTNSA